MLTMLISILCHANIMLSYSVLLYVVLFHATLVKLDQMTVAG